MSQGSPFANSASESLLQPSSVFSSSSSFGDGSVTISKSGVPGAQQPLTFRGKQVADTMTLAEGRVETGNVLHLVLALRGG